MQMEDTLSLILHGCRLARDLESNFRHLSTQPILLAKSCDDLTKVFKTATDSLNSVSSSSSFPQMNIHDTSLPRVSSELDTAVQAWLKSSNVQTMNFLQGEQFSVHNTMVIPELKVFELGGMNVDYKDSGEGSSRSRTETEFPTPAGPELGKIPVVQRSRKRKDGDNKRTVRVSAPRIGNTEIPPDDGFTWRKYGQKEILGTTFPRGYYRCTHKNFYGCQAKKQVQRLDEDPNTFELTYYGHHTCHTSQTAPSAQPQSTEIQETLQPPLFAPTSSIPIPLNTWLNMDVDPTSSRATRGSPAGRSSLRDTKEPEYPVFDFADTMFNSGSSNNSMDSIFPSSMEDK